MWRGCLSLVMRKTAFDMCKEQLCNLMSALTDHSTQYNVTLFLTQNFKPLCRFCSCDNRLEFHMSLVMRKPAFCICENKDAYQLYSYCAADQRLFLLHKLYNSSTFYASSYVLRLYSPVCVRPGRKPQRPVFSQRGAYGHLVSKTFFSAQLLT